MFESGQTVLHLFFKEVTQSFTHSKRGGTVFHLFSKDSFGHSLVRRHHSLLDLPFLKETH